MKLSKTKSKQNTCKTMKLSGGGNNNNHHPTSLLLPFKQLAYQREENLSKSSKAHDILKRITQDYVNCTELSADYKNKHREFLEMYMTLSKLFLLWQQSSSKKDDTSEYLLKLIQESNILPAEEIQAYRSSQDRVMTDFYDINQKIDKEFFTEDNAIFKELTPEEVSSLHTLSNV